MLPRHRPCPTATLDTPLVFLPCPPGTVREQQYLEISRRLAALLPSRRLIGLRSETEAELRWVEAAILLAAAAAAVLLLVVVAAWLMPWLPPCRSARRRSARVVRINSPYGFSANMLTAT